MAFHFHLLDHIQMSFVAHTNLDLHKQEIS